MSETPRKLPPEELEDIRDACDFGPVDDAIERLAYVEARLAEQAEWTCEWVDDEDGWRKVLLLLRR